MIKFTRSNVDYRLPGPEFGDAHSVDLVTQVKYDMAQRAHTTVARPETQRFSITVMLFDCSNYYATRDEILTLLKSLAADETIYYTDPRNQRYTVRLSNKTLDVKRVSKYASTVTLVLEKVT